MRLTIDFHELAGGVTKATVYKDTNTYMYDVVGYDVYTALSAAVNEYPFYLRRQSVQNAVERRVD